MAPDGGCDVFVIANKEKSFYNHSANAIIKVGPIYCIWEVKEEISIKGFQEFIDGLFVARFGSNALMNICKSK